MKKALIITGVLDFGGVERLAVDTAKELIKRKNYHPIICSLLKSNESFIKELDDAQIEYYSLEFKSIKNIISNLIAIRKFIKKCNPDIIHTHQFASDFYGTVGSLGLKIPIISHLHNPQMEKFSRKTARFILSRFFIRAFIAVVDEKADALKRLIPSAKIFTLYNSINPENLRLSDNFNRETYRAKLSIPKNCFVIGSVGRLSQEKGYDLLLQAFKEILETEKNFFLILIGGGPEEKNLKKLAQNLKITDKVIFTGYRKDIADLVSVFDIFVVSSRIESFPLVSLEAMYLNIPTIITDKLSSKDILSHAATVVSCSIDGLKNEILSLSKDKNLREEMSEKGKKMVEKEFTMNNYVYKLEKIYDEIINNKL